MSSVPISCVSAGWYPEGFVHGLSPIVAILLRSLPFDVLIACFCLPFLECPGDVRRGVIVGGAYNCFDEFSFEIILQDFDGSSIVKFDVGIFG